MSAASDSPPAAQSDQPENSAPRTVDETRILPEENDDEGVDDITSDRAPSIASSTTSLAASVLNFRKENGRTYHKYKDGKYHYPNDETENDRLDLQHHLFLLTLNNKLGLAPPNDAGSGVKRVLDVGTGTGIWAMDFGDEHPEAEVLGVDLSPTQAEFIPPNVKFEVDDIEEPWLYSRPFDYIHSRLMTSSIANWKEYLQKAYNHLEPGGYLELQESDLEPCSDDDTLTPEHTLSKVSKLLGEACEKLGRPFKDILALVDVMADIGFVDITVTKFKWPTNPWPKDAKHKELGEWANRNFTTGMDGFIMAPFTRVLNWTREEVLLLQIQVRKDLRDRNIHAYWPIYSIYGRKPVNTTFDPPQA